jgi:undecaprenyl-diphosphatase
MANSEVSLVRYVQTFPKEYESIVTLIMRIISIPFSLFYFLFIVYILYCYKKITKDQLNIIIVSQIILWLIKNLVKRDRPHIADTTIHYLESMTIDQYSFPSGHAMNAFLLAFILEKNMGINIHILAYMVGLSRIYLGVHYPTDILGGYILAKVMLNSSYWLSKN